MINVIYGVLGQEGACWFCPVQFYLLYKLSLVNSLYLSLGKQLLSCVKIYGNKVPKYLLTIRTHTLSQSWCNANYEEFAQATIKSLQKRLPITHERHKTFHDIIIWQSTWMDKFSGALSSFLNCFPSFRRCSCSFYCDIQLLPSYKQPGDTDRPPSLTVSLLLLLLELHPEFYSPNFLNRKWMHFFSSRNPWVAMMFHHYHLNSPGR